jgi:bifunctional DNase/RNase
MEKVKLEIVGLSYSQTQSGAYALVLSETNGNRRLPIIIGGFEAQAIAIELEKMSPTRPLTHDLFKSFAAIHDIEITEVLIYNLSEGIFYAKLICEHQGKKTEIDARTSDAIAVGIRVGCPIFTYEKILSSAGIKLDETDDGSPKELETSEEATTAPAVEDVKQMTIAQLEEELDKALDAENYEKASKIRDEINRRSS